MDSESLLHDHSTLGGKLQIVLKRLSWKWILPGMFFMALLTFSIAYGNTKPEQVLQQQAFSPSSASPYLINNNNEKDLLLNRNLYANFSATGRLKVAGVENELVLFPHDLTLIPDFSRAAVREIHLKNVLINAPALSQSLQGCLNLERLTFEKVSVTGEFSRVYLPNLREFFYNQHRNDDMDEYKQPEKLKSLLFFDSDPSQSWDLKELLNLNKNITVSVGGTTILVINRAKGIINLNIHFCEFILSRAQGPFKELSLSWCNTTAASMSPEVEYLNLNNAVPEKQELSRIVQKTRNLREFHALLPFLCENISYVTPEYPELQIEVNLADFPPSIRTLSFSKLQLLSRPVQPSAVTSLAIEQSNVTGLVEEFSQIFPQLEKFALFNLTNWSQAYSLLSSAINSPSTEWILMEYFSRVPTTLEEEGIEDWLVGVGVPELANNFLLERSKGGKKDVDKKGWSGRTITDFEKNYFRFQLLAFNSIDSYDDYLIWDSKINSGFEGPVV